MISQTAEYALRAIVYLADNPTDAQTAEAIAKGTKVPVGYLAKIMQGLARSGLVTSAAETQPTQGHLSLSVPDFQRDIALRLDRRR